jgi:hypothetical protein
MEGLGSVVFFIIMGVVYVLGQVLENRNKRKPDWQQPAPGRAPESPPPEPPDLPEPEPHVYEVEAVRGVPGSVTVRQAPRVAPRSPREREIPRPVPAKPAPVAARQWLAGPDNLRRAMIIMTVLGPPVSQQSPDERPG